MMIAQPMLFVCDAPSVSSHYEKEASGVEKALEKALNGVKITQLKAKKQEKEPLIAPDLFSKPYIAIADMDWRGDRIMVYPVELACITHCEHSYWRCEGMGWFCETIWLSNGKLERIWNIEKEVSVETSLFRYSDEKEAKSFALDLSWGLPDEELPSDIKDAQFQAKYLKLDKKKKHFLVEASSEYEEEEEGENV